ncbi:MAG: hypothetical protein ACQEV7_03240 [Bacillota bacterium]
MDIGGSDMSFNHKNLRIIKVSNDRNGNFMKLAITLSDGFAIIRWSLDDFTFKRIKEIVFMNYFDKLEKEYHFELVPIVETCVENPKGERKFIGNVRCVQRRQAARIEFECSEKFAGNMEWLKREVRSLKDIKHLFWENFQEW